MNKHNDDCYSVYHLQVDSPTLFDDCVDATFVLTMEGSTRANKFMEQLYKFRPTKNVYIIFNKGYKTCDKLDIHDNKIMKSNIDLIDAYVYMLKFSKQMNFKYVLNLEDDFHFQDDILKNPNHSEEICKFIKFKKPSVYSLGNFNAISLDIFSIHKRPLEIAPAHALILNVDLIDNLLTEFLEKQGTKNFQLKSIDTSFMSKVPNSFFYFKPICRQTFPMSENRKEWDNTITNFFIKLLYLDTHYEGWDIMYFLTYFFTTMCIIYIFSFIIKKLRGGNTLFL